MKPIWFVEVLSPLRRRVTLTRLFGAITAVLGAVVIFLGWRDLHLDSRLSHFREDRAALAERCRPLRPIVVNELEAAARNLSTGQPDRVVRLHELQVVLARTNAAVRLCFTRDPQHDTLGLGRNPPRIGDELFRIAASHDPSMSSRVVHSRPVSAEEVEALARVVDEGWAVSRAGGPWLGATRTSLNEP